MAQEPIDTKQVAKILSVSVWLVKKWRRDGTGPKWFRIGARIVQYELADVTKWKASRQRVSAAPEERTHGK